jgi:subtilisin-like proprotein convertase family protein
VRRTGSIANGDDVVMIGHPVVLPKKNDAGGECKNANGAVAWFNANVDAYGGNSGSMVINRVTGEIEGILVRGNPDFNTSSGCARSNVCPESGCPGWEEISKSTGFASFVPPLGLQVAPAGNVTMLGIVGGPFTNDPLVYTLSNPSGGAVDYEVSFVSGGSAPLLMDGGSGPLAGTLASGGSVMVSISTDPSTTSLPAGVYATTVSFRDVTNSRTESRVHTLEIGQTGIDVTPTTGFVSGGPVGGPFAATRTYTITSTRPTPVTVDVSASASWISLDGGTGPVMLSLSGIGDSEDIVVGFSSDALTLPAGIASGTVTFDNVEGALGDTTRAVTLDVGRYSYAPSDIPKPISDNQTITSTITVTDSYCIGDVDVELNITHTYIGDLIVELRSPLGTAVRLHNRTGGSADNIIRTYDDETTPPDPPATLAAFDGEQVTGVWTLTVSDNASQDVGALNAWTLKIAAGPPGCAAPEIIYEFPLNSSPGWSTTGQWAFGVPTGGGSANHDPTSGYTGSNVYGYNLSGDYANSIPEHYLTTTPIDLTGVTNTRLEFRRWLGIESSTYDHAAVQVSNNGVSWTTVWSHAGTSFSESAWSLQSYSIAAVADNQPAVRIRWVMGTTDSSVTYPGWNIDDVRIKGVPPPADCPGDTNGDRMVDNADLQAILDAWASMTGDPEYTDGADLNDDGTVDNFDLQELLDNWAQPCP